MAKRWYYKDENGNKVPVPQYKINADDYFLHRICSSHCKNSVQSERKN